MKHLVTTAILAATIGSANALTFDFQAQFAAEEYVPGYDARHIAFAPVAPSASVVSLNRWMQQANVDGIAPNDFQGVIVETGPTRISLYEFVRDSPEGIAHAGYHERFPADTDWDRVARDHRDAAVADSTPMRASDS
jgi:hypothetical protein